MSKRSHDWEESNISGQEPPKKVVLLEPPSIKSISSSEDMELQVLRIQNMNLSIKCKEQHKTEIELKNTISELERQRVQDKAIISILCNSINENHSDVNFLLSKIEGGKNFDFKRQFDHIEPTFSFMERLTGLSSSFISEEIKSKINQSFEITKKLYSLVLSAPSVLQNKNNSFGAQSTEHANFSIESCAGFERSPSEFQTNTILPENYENTKCSQGVASKFANSPPIHKNGNDHVYHNAKEENHISEHDNCSPQNQLNIPLNDDEYFKFREIIRQYCFINDRHDILQKEIENLQTRLEDTNCDLRASTHRYEVLVDRYNSLKSQSSSSSTTIVESQPKPSTEPIVEELKAELEAQKQLSESRLKEIENFQHKYKAIKLELNSLKDVSIKNIPEDLVYKSSPYLMIKNQHTLLLADSALLKQQIDCLKKVIKSAKTDRSHFISTMKNNMTKYTLKIKEQVDILKKELVEAKVQFERYKNLSQLNSYFNSESRFNYSETLKTLENFRRENIKLKEEMCRLTNLPNDDKSITISPDSIINSEQPSTIEDPQYKFLIEQIEILTNTYEDMDTRNTSLVQQIEEMEKAHFSSITESIKTAQLQKVLKEEKDIVTKQLDIYKSLEEEYKQKIEQLEVHNGEIKKEIENLTKDTTLKDQLIEVYKQKAQEALSLYSQSHFTIEQFKFKQADLETRISELNSLLEDERFKVRRKEEEALSLKKKLDKANQNQYAGATDRILLEEVRMLKTKLTCNCCNTNPKDAILTKCFHIFCFDCVATMYNTRQRKCPRCAQSFGNNDFHRIYF